VSRRSRMTRFDCSLCSQQSTKQKCHGTAKAGERREEGLVAKTKESDRSISMTSERPGVTSVYD
jgi:hypothetical protein